MANLHKEVDRGVRAAQLLENETYKESVGKVREGIMLRWAQSPLADREGQHTLRLMLKLLDDLEGNIREVALTGKMAEQQIELEKQRDSWAKQVLTRMGVRV